MFEAVADFCPFGIVETVECADKVAGNPTDSLESRPFIFCATAFWATLVDNAMVPAYRIAVYRMINRTITHTAFFHAADDRFQ